MITAGAPMFIVLQPQGQCNTCFCCSTYYGRNTSYNCKKSFKITVNVKAQHQEVRLVKYLALFPKLKLVRF